MRAIMVSVDYTDLLSITLSYNRHHFSSVHIVTSSQDATNVTTIADANNARVWVTDLFYADGARFNKWAAIEWAFDQIGRYSPNDRWWCLMDADVLWPKTVDLARHLHRGILYTPRRRICDPIPHVIPEEKDWGAYPLHRQEREFAGYSQIFHCEDARLGDPPWHQTDWAHAGGADSFFQYKWPDFCKVRPLFEVLHLGPAGQNWAGRVSPYRDGTSPEHAAERARYVRSIWTGRQGKAPADRYAHEKIDRERGTAST